MKDFSTHIFDVAIIGGGPVGLFSVFQCGMLGLKSIIIDNFGILGGQCSILYPDKLIYDIPGFIEIKGKDLIQSLLKQIEPFKPEVILNEKAVSFNKFDEIFELKLQSGKKIYTKSIIISTGEGVFAPRKPSLKYIEKYDNKNIFYAVSDISIFYNKNLVIAGGGDSAIDWCIELSNIAKKIYFVHRRLEFRAFDNNVQKMLKIANEQNSNIEIVTPFQIHEIYEINNNFSGVKVKSIDQKEELKILKSDFLLAFFGIQPDSSNLNNFGVNLNKSSKIIVDYSTMSTNIDGVFAIGDVCSYGGKLKLILTGFSESAIASHAIYKYINPKKTLHIEHSTSKGIVKF